jgi:hypothetical protein
VPATKVGAGANNILARKSSSFGLTKFSETLKKKQENKPAFSDSSSFGSCTSKVKTQLKKLSE